MGWNEAEITLLASGWDATIEDAATPWSETRNNARFLRSERGFGSAESELFPGIVATWLEDRNFEVREKSANLMHLSHDEIDVFLCLEDYAVAEVVVRFTLERTSPSHWADWQRLIQRVSERFDLSVFDPERGFKVNATEALRVLASTQAWRDSEASFNWPAVTAENDYKK